MSWQVGGDNTMLNDLTQSLQCLLLLNRCYWTRWNDPILQHHTYRDVDESLLTVTENAMLDMMTKHRNCLVLLTEITNSDLQCEPKNTPKCCLSYRKRNPADHNKIWCVLT